MYEKNIIVPKSSDKKYWDVLKAFVNENNIEYAMIHPENAVLEWSLLKKNGGNWPCKTILPDYDLVKIFFSEVAISS